MDKTQLNSRWSWLRRRFVFLLATLLFMLAVVPFLESWRSLTTFFNIFLSAVLVSAVYVLSQKIRDFVAAVVLAIPMLLSIWSDYFTLSDALFSVGRICGVLFFALTIFHILRHIFQQQEVTRDTIAGAAAVYLLFALMWAFIYVVLERLQPGSFATSSVQPLEGTNIFIYFSLVTITTLGYGDIVPVTYITRSLAALEAVVGQLYLVVLVSWLVGMYVSKKSRPL